jgi:hypothetical protein
MFLLLRFCCATVSAYIFAVYLPLPPVLLYGFSRVLDEYDREQWLWYHDLAFKVRFITAMLWMATWAFLEFRSFRRVGQPAPRLLTHLRYGPIAISILSVATIFASDFLLIQYSRWQLVRWIHSDVAVTEKPSVRLYSDYRGWCGNGMASYEYDLYGDTPAAYIDDSDPAVRARALQASMYVYDWLNNPNDGPSIAALKKASSDPDPMVRQIAANFTAELNPGLAR